MRKSTVQDGGMFRLSLKLKLLLVLISLSIVPVVLASIGWYQAMFRSSMKHSAEITSQYTKLVADGIDHYTSGINRSLDPLLIDPNFQKLIRTPRSDIVQQARYSLEFEPMLQTFLQSHNEVLGILYLDVQGKVLYQSVRKSMNYLYPFADDAYFTYIDAIRATTLSTVHASNYLLGQPEEILSIIRPVIDLSDGQVTSWLLVDIRVNYFRMLMTGRSPGEDGQIMLYDSVTGAIVANQRIDETLMRGMSAQLAEHTGAFTWKSGRLLYQAVPEKLGYGDWTLIWVSPLEAISQGVSQSLLWTLIIASSALLLCGIISFPAMNVLLRPLDKLIGGMRKLSRGTYEPVDGPQGGDEIGFLVRTYNRMLVELERMEREVYQAKLREREKELLQLQAQTNPHFFFNTLETIEAFADLHNGEAVGDLVQRVSRMMRYTARNDAGWAPLREELSFIRDFLSVHEQRNGKAVRTFWAIDPTLLEMPVMRLSIQPFVENAMKYGWSPALPEDGFALTIAAERTANSVRFRIADTGVGIGLDILEQLNRLPEQADGEPTPYFRKHTGMYNLCRRLSLVYGGRARVRFAVGPERGTVVELTIEDEGK
ncbi:sensor histidine kinase [Paenibacillus sp. GCM10023250]|uniref:sensor histidine kinase n=1 Tax=Paenibacillus sp. GCM10023250 TaxID=3252648 RepID=UPI0036194AA1